MHNSDILGVTQRLLSLLFGRNKPGEGSYHDSYSLENCTSCIDVLEDIFVGGGCTLLDLGLLFLASMLYNYLMDGFWVWRSLFFCVRTYIIDGRLPFFHLFCPDILHKKTTN